MAMNDPLSDMLTRIRNANMVLKSKVEMPSSKLKEALAGVLKKEGYIRDYSVADKSSGTSKALTIYLKYSKSRQRVINGIKSVSKPGLRVYTKADKIPRAMGGLGIAVLSTSSGLMTDRVARSRKVGGEILCYVW